MTGMSKYLYAGIAGAVVAKFFSNAAVNLIPDNIQEALPVSENYVVLLVAFLLGASTLGVAEYLRWEIIRKLLTYRCERFL